MGTRIEKKCSYYPYMELLSLHAATIPTWSYYPYIELLSLHGATIPTWSYIVMMDGVLWAQAIDLTKLRLTLPYIYISATTNACGLDWLMARWDASLENVS